MIISIEYTTLRQILSEMSKYIQFLNSYGFIAIKLFMWYVKDLSL